LNAGTLAPGTHLLTVSATDSDSSPDTGSWSISIQVNPVNLHIDAPQPGATVSGTITVAGWVLDNTSVAGVAISSVQVKVDGNVVGSATYGSSRPDVCSVYAGRPGCPNVGFAYQLNAVALSSGSHTITATATDTNGNAGCGLCECDRNGGGHTSNRAYRRPDIGFGVVGVDHDLWIGARQQLGSWQQP
jgi:hypothetical protein